MHPVFSSGRYFAATILFWASICFLFALLTVELAKTHISAPYAESFSLVVPWYLILLFFCFSNIYVCRRVPLGSNSLTRVALFQWLSAALTTGLWLGLGYLWAGELAHLGLEQTRELYLKTLHIHWILGGSVYMLWVLIHYLYLKAAGSETVNSDQLRQELLVRDIELKAVKAAVHPHFMYNSLNMLANLSLAAPEKIHSICVQMSEFLRYSVNYSKKEHVTVADELKHIENYLSVERERFGDHLHVNFSIDDSICDYDIMPLILFPLVENAIKHGIDSQLEQGYIDIKLQGEKGKIHIDIKNSYDPQGRKMKNTGLGLEALAKRLNAYYGDAATITIDKSEKEYSLGIQLPIRDEVKALS
ncbi:Putative regulator of cell autolysis [Alteromonadaceae bacterium Bs31]|nr:Putative regulator of cell autolysis [Alteromonadaceae bacterium Bs31]